MMMNQPALLSSEGPFDLRSVPFSRRGSFLCIHENEQDRCLYLCISRSPKMWMQRPNLVRLQFLRSGNPMPISYVAEPGRLLVKAGKGTAEYCLDSAGDLHLRLQGMELEMHCEKQSGDRFLSLGRQQAEMIFPVIGRLRLTTEAGSMSTRISCQPESFVITLEPEAENDTAEMTVLQDAIDFTGHSRAAESFDMCVAHAQEDFYTFAGRYFKEPERVSAFDLSAAWTIWNHTMGPAGNLKHEVVYMTRLQWLRAFGWQQSFHSMSVTGDAQGAWDLIETIFDYLDPAGQLPDSIGDIGSAYLVTKPALQGVAFLRWTQRYQLSQIAKAKRKTLYAGMSRFASWWLKNRDRNHSGLPQYYHGDESPGEFCTCFRKGVPLYSPDLAAFLILLMESCAVLADSLGKAEEALAWKEYSGRLMKRMMDLLWNGERFVFRLAADGQVVSSGGFMHLLPILLGERLPEEVLLRLTDMIGDENEYLGADGITIENMHDMNSLPNHPGPKGSPIYVSTLLCLGLDAAGEKTLMKKIAERVVAGIRENGFTFMHTMKPSGTEKHPEKWTSWSAACYLILRDLRKE